MRHEVSVRALLLYEVVALAEGMGCEKELALFFEADEVLVVCERMCDCHLAPPFFNLSSL